LSEPVPRTKAIRRAEAILRAACGDRLRREFPLAPLTTFRIGGHAALYLEAEAEADLAAAAEAVCEADVPAVVIGKGSNVLVSDLGFQGLVLRLGRSYRWAARDGERLTAGGAMPLAALSGVALSHSLSGLEFGVAIPGSFAGAVAMNAGAHGREIAEVIEWIDVFELRAGAMRRVPVAEVGFRYRGTNLPQGGVITGARARLEGADALEIRRRMDEAREWRRRTQPLAEPNCGSVFKNPPGEHAARLVDDAGGKGLTVGGARVSTKHANFIVTEEGAHAVDVVRLIRAVQELVSDRFGIELEPEVRLVGDFSVAPR